MSDFAWNWFHAGQWVCMVEVIQCFFSITEVGFRFPGMIRVVIAFPMDKEFQFFIFISCIDNPVHLPFIVSVFSDVDRSRPVRGLPLQVVTVRFNL